MHTDPASHPTTVLIIGAGLAGLTAADRLRKRKVPFHIVEARSRVGGRALTVSPAGDSGGGDSFDLGATWYWSHHVHLQRLLAELGIETFPQYLQGDALFDQGEEVAASRFVATTEETQPQRIVGGAQRICDELAKCLPPGSLSVHTVVEKVVAAEKSVVVHARSKDGGELRFDASYVIVTLPLRLAVHRLRFVPELPVGLKQAMLATPTWMSRAMKCLLVYQTPFWRAEGLSGYMVSPIGPVEVLHDASSKDGTGAALFGFLSNHPACRRMAPERRRHEVVQQLVRLFGPQAGNPLHYLELDWTHEPFTSLPNETLDANGHPDYGHVLFREPLWGGRLWWAGTETARRAGGYLEGAVVSGEDVARQILRRVRGKVVPA